MKAKTPEERHARQRYQVGAALIVAGFLYGGSWANKTTVPQQPGVQDVTNLIAFIPALALIVVGAMLYRKGRAEFRQAGAHLDVRSKILSAKLSSFPKIGESPPALIAGYAALRWGREQLSEVELTAADVQAVAHRLGIPHEPDMYREAFRGHPRAVSMNTDKVTTPFKLMEPGDAALDAYLGSLAAGGTPTDAEARAALAEEQAAQAA